MHVTPKDVQEENTWLNAEQDLAWWLGRSLECQRRACTHPALCCRQDVASCKGNTHCHASITHKHAYGLLTGMLTYIHVHTADHVD